MLLTALIILGVCLIVSVAFKHFEQKRLVEMFERMKDADQTHEYAQIEVLAEAFQKVLYNPRPELEEVAAVSEEDEESSDPLPDHEQLDEQLDWVWEPESPVYIPNEDFESDKFMDGENA